MQFQKTVTIVMQFQKTITSFMLIFKKNVTFVCSSGETIRHSATKKTRLQVVILTGCKKTFFRVAKS